MPRLVRRKPLMQRLSAMLNPMDTLLWISEEMETRDWDSKQLGSQVGLALNFLFLLGRANYTTKPASDDVFSEAESSGWFSWLVFPIVWGLAIFSFTNALYTITRNRKYRMFEANIDVQPATPSARRVQVQSSPATSSPLRMIANMITPDTPDSRAHPDKARDVWELSVWDPLPISLRMFCFFSPGHVLVYLIFLPLAPLDPRPSMTVFNTLVMQIVLSGQLLFLCDRFSQQGRDNAILQKEVMHEYDAKFVHPMLHPVVRDAGVQTADGASAGTAEVEVGTPTTLIRRTFKTNGNPHIEGGEPTTTHSNRRTSQVFTPTPVAGPRRSDVFVSPSTGFQSPATRYSLPVSASTNSLPYTSTGTNLASLGGQKHTNSPLKKTISLNDVNAAEQSSPRNSREMAAFEQRQRHYPSSPLKQAEARQQQSRTSSGPSSSMFANTARSRIHQQGNARPRF